MNDARRGEPDRYEDGDELGQSEHKQLNQQIAAWVVWAKGKYLLKPSNNISLELARSVEPSAICQMVPTELGCDVTS